MITSVTETLDKDEFKARLAKAGIAFGGVNSVDDLSKHPALTLRNVMTDGESEIAIPAPPIRWLDTPESSKLGRAPALGEHTEVVREEFLAELETSKSSVEEK
ncbi:hypothetical protein JCM19233_2596 [Vibrio astriarenae]|nr:hypothetical protein JCM19233_2596 [Vibrio sp. C7]